MRASFSKVAAITAGVVIGGGGCMGGDAENGGGRPTKTSFETEVRALYCARNDRCCRMKGRPLDEMLCSSAAGATFSFRAGNKAAFNPELAAKCLHILREWSCNDQDSGAIGRACALAYSGAGTTAEDGTCLFDVECAQPSDGTTALCDGGRCKRQPTYLATGAACDITLKFSCDLYDSCGLDATGTAICQPLLAPDATCTPLGAQCGPNLACSAEGTCVPPGRTGEPCVIAACEGGSICVEGTCRALTLSGQYSCKDP